MTETNTMTYDELAQRCREIQERNRELEEAIQKALAQYGKGGQVFPIFKGLKEVV